MQKYSHEPDDESGASKLYNVTRSLAQVKGVKYWPDNTQAGTSGLYIYPALILHYFTIYQKLNKLDK